MSNMALLPPWSSPRVEDGALLPQSHSDGWPASSPTRCHNLTVQLTVLFIDSKYLTKYHMAFLFPQAVRMRAYVML